METAGRKTPVFFASLWIVAFFLNFFWECLHGLLYQDHPQMEAIIYVPMMVEMAFYDAVAVSGLYLFHALVFRSLLWGNTVSHIAVFFLAAIITAAVVEYAAAHLLHAWNYLPSMPTVAGIGLLPMLQLAVTGVASIFAAERLSSHKAA